MSGVKGKSGGKREGAGKKSRYNEECTIVRLVVPARFKQEIKLMIDDYCKKHGTPQPP